MTVAAFFRTAKASGALGGTPDQAREAIDLFFATYDYPDCTPLQLLALADLAQRAQDESVAREALRRVVQSGTMLHLASYRLGRLALGARAWAQAIEHFTAGTAADPDFAFNWIGLARALHASGQTAAAQQAAATFISFGQRPHGREDFAVLGEQADRLFEAKDFPAARALYAFLLEHGAQRPRDVLQLAETYLQTGDPAGAVAFLRAQQANRRLDAAGQRLLTMCEARAGLRAPAAVTAPRDAATAAKPAAASGGAPRTAAAAQAARAALLESFQRNPDQAALAEAIATQAELLGPTGLAEARTRLLKGEGDLDGAVRLLEAEAFTHQSRMYYLAMETGYACVQADRLDLVERIADKLAALAPHEAGVKILRIDGYFRAKLWERAGPYFASMSEADHARPNVILKYFEYSYFTGDLQRAAELFEKLDRMKHPSRQYMLPMLRYLAEQQDWQALIDHAVAWIGPDFIYPQVGYVLFRGARYTGRHQDMLRAIEAIEGWADKPDLCRLRAILLLDCAADLAALDALAADPQAAAGGENFRYQLDARRAVLAAAAGPATRQAVFLCADRAFLCGMIVTLHNMTRHADTAHTDFYIVVDDDDAALARRFTRRFADDGISVEVIAASAVVDGDAQLDAVYGIFNSGQILSRAAYYRIYFARYLQRLGRHHRGFYIDGDVLARAPIDAIFRLDMQGKALAARLEKTRPEVLRAAALHDLPDGRFFNSGVLLFDFTHPELPAALERAIEASTNPAIKLIYHDQCALNRAFRGDFMDLDPIWNFAMTEATPAGEMPENAVVLHFLDRPKPWSAAHGGVASALWYAQWRDTAGYLGEAVAVELFATLKD